MRSIGALGASEVVDGKVGEFGAGEGGDPTLGFQHVVAYRTGREPGDVRVEAARVVRVRRGDEAAVLGHDQLPVVRLHVEHAEVRSRGDLLPPTGQGVGVI